MTRIQTTQNTITIQPLYKWDSEESQMTSVIKVQSITSCIINQNKLGFVNVERRPNDIEFSLMI